MNGTAADRLRRLRWVLTASFTAINALGIVIFAVLMIRQDAEWSEQRLDADLDRVTSAVSRLVAYDGSINYEAATKDELNNACPQFAIMPGSAQAFRAHRSNRECVPVDSAVFSGLATTAQNSGQVLVGYQQGTGGELVRVRVQPLLNPSGAYIAAVVAAADATPTRAAHTRLILLVVGGAVILLGVAAALGHILSGRAIRPAAAALEQQEVLLAETAHDLRTPVAALRALAEAALRNPSERADLLPRTVGLAARMGGIIDGLLVRARLAAGVEQLAMQPVWLDQLVQAVVEETQADGAQVTLTAAPTKVVADPTLLQRAVGNLLDNAIRYGRQPGADAIVHVTVAGDKVIVADSGPGVDTTTAEAAFERFTGSGGSSGLGLSIVRWVALAHGGTLNVYNAEEGGAIFELVLPLYEG